MYSDDSCLIVHSPKARICATVATRYRPKLSPGLQDT
jgi:hypothetical protein